MTIPPEFYQLSNWIDGLSNQQMAIYFFAVIGAWTFLKFLFSLTTR